MKVLRNVLGICVVTLTFSSTASAGIMQTGCHASSAGYSTGLLYQVVLNVVQSIITTL